MKPFSTLFSASAFILAVLASAQKVGAPTNQQPAPAKKALEFNGQRAPDAVIQINGRLYLDALALSQLTGVAVAVRPDRVILTIPGANAASPPPQQQQDPNRLSREFARNTIACLGELREWRNSLETAISIGAPEGLQLETFLNQHRNRAEESLRIAAVSASTPGDKKALQLLQNAFSKVQQWDNTAADARRNLNGAAAVDPNALSNDPVLASINQCGKFLAEMISSGNFYDTGVCH